MVETVGEATSQHDTTYQINIDKTNICEVHQIAWKHDLIMAVQGRFF